MLQAGHWRWDIDWWLWLGQLNGDLVHVISTIILESLLAPVQAIRFLIFFVVKHCWAGLRLWVPAFGSFHDLWGAYFLKARYCSGCGWRCPVDFDASQRVFLSLTLGIVTCSHVQRMVLILSHANPFSLLRVCDLRGMINRDRVSCALALS